MLTSARQAFSRIGEGDKMEKDEDRCAVTADTGITMIEFPEANIYSQQCLYLIFISCQNYWGEI